ncbi:MAG: EAL domain-containing protein [Pirellulaceae bacterium]|nr:EAL domain-containing protein [Pirellulaceae bacterium]
MNETNAQARRVLIIDDQEHIHDTFERVFANSNVADEALMDFEQMFLSDDSDVSNKNQNSQGAGPQYLVTHAVGGEAGVVKVQEAVDQGNRFSVAFVDMRMPNGMDGLETTEKLWEIDPHLQVVICTAYSDHTWDDVLKRLGYNDRLLLLKKPFERDEARQLALALSEKCRLADLQEEKVQELRDEVTRRRQAEEELRVMAHRDALTLLPNRPYLLEHLETLLADGNRGDKHDALLFLDLDNFKIINDSLGHDAGDDLLNQVAERLKECVRHRDSAGAKKSRDKTVRLGGDEFVVLLEKMAEKEDAFDIARRIVQRIAEPFKLGDRYVNVGTSVGVAFIDSSIKDAHDALRNADTAMYRAKNAGKGQIAVFDKTMHQAVVARHDMENQIRLALENEDFEVRYQPIIDLDRAVVQGVEALIRWQNEDGQYVSPMEFIPITEEIGLITQLGEWVFETAMREFGQMLRSLPSQIDSNVYLGVNVSRRQLSDPFFLDRLDTIVAKTGFDRSLVKIEMNEAGDPRHNERSMATMLGLHDAGVGIHIDDFGKGKSSLTCFQAYPIETVKIDRSFTASIASDHGHAVIAQAIVQLAHHLNATIVCEGVESECQLQLLRNWGCDSAQGYLFAQALTIHELQDLLQNPSQSEGIRMLNKTAPVAPLVMRDDASGMSIQIS